MPELTADEQAQLEALQAKAAAPEEAPPAPEGPALGSWVLYTLSEGDAATISAQRAHYSSQQAGLDDELADKLQGFQPHRGNPVQEGKQFPAIVVAGWGGPAVNLQVLLDGTDTYWATSATPGDGGGHYVVPTAEPAAGTPNDAAHVVVMQ